ncbi:MAG TPA: pyridoxamine 5'-phosphate oxidase [Bacteroidia bacterium]|jgi:pyridoxamine 5'-phosphate oxidase|nr:pyridoxamine 5'-phosphate oxidase [Bacteroidia bacterium]
MNSLNEYTKNLRHDFVKANFNEKDANNNPFKQFEKWYAEAIKSGLSEPNAMALCTATKKGKPSSRIVLLRGLKNHGFNFFTNYYSRKGNELKENPYASLLFYWPELERQIRIEGKVVFASIKASDEYFNLRPRESRIGAWASQQSKIISGRKELDKLVKSISEKYDEKIPRPENWGGYVLQATYYEFWQGRQNRLHDRICYSLKNGKWKKARLAP